MSGPALVLVSTHCTNCGREVELETEGLPGFFGYPTFNEYFCPHCGKHNHERTPGAIVAARMPRAAAQLS